MTVIDRREFVAEGTAVKAPCRAATTANIVLSGLQTIDAIALAEGDRVLVKNQTDGSQNGIYTASSGNWLRTRDFDGAYDVVTGTRVYVNSGTSNGGVEWTVTTVGTLVPDQVSLSFASIAQTAISAAAAAAISAASAASHDSASATHDTNSAASAVAAAASAALAATIYSPIVRPIGQHNNTTYSFALGDETKWHRFSNASAITVTIPLNSSVAFAIGTQLDCSQTGAGKVTFAGAGGVTINSVSSNKSISAQYAAATLLKVDTDTWDLVGSLIA